MRRIAEQEKRHAVGFDAMFERLKANLGRLSWIDQTFGRAWDIERTVGTRKIVEPCVYCKGNSYETLVPSSDLGNYSFCVLEGNTEVDTAYETMSSDFAVVVWVDLRRCFGGDVNRRDTENLKLELLKTIRETTFGRGNYIRIESVAEDADAVWSGWNLSNEENQFMIQPFAAFRVRGEMTSNICY